ncbi:MAG TPA: nuclear transport factor 2 family protein [Ilumatobacteraceae bacterium]|nr:nuclear transport factor 2 family protein [Ilumatobacteraceae bacterium]
MSRDWDAWARQVEKALHVVNRSDTDFQDLFAPDATFVDPTQTKTTAELPEVSRQTQSLFPDWTQEVTSIRGGDDWAAFEWIGRGTPTWRGQTAERAIAMEGITLVEVDAEGLVTKWRDYFDMKGVEEQIREALTQSS